MLSKRKLKKRTNCVIRYNRIGNQYINDDIIRLIKLCFKHNNSISVFLDDDNLDNIFFKKEKGNLIYASFFEYDYGTRYEEIFIIENIPYIGQLKNINVDGYNSKRKHYKNKYNIISYPYKIIDVINSEMFKQRLINDMLEP